MRASVWIGSLAANVGMLALLARALTPIAAAPRRPPPPKSPARDPISIELLSDPPTRGAPRNSPLGGHGDVARAMHAGIAHETPHGGERAGDGGTPSGTSLMAMRRPDLKLGASQLAALAGSGELPAAVPITGQITWRAGRGVAQIGGLGGAAVDPTAETTRDADPLTTMTVDRDGSVEFHDSPAFSLHAGSRVGRLWLPLPLIWGRLEITDALMRAFKVGDPYAARKLKLLDDTRPERAERGAEFRAEQLKHAPEFIRANLARVAALADVAQQHRALFALWDECVEGDGPEGEAGQLARGQIIAWIWSHMPEDGPAAFTPADIAAFDAQRSSKQHFAPYP